MTTSIEIRVDWLDAPGVTSPELGATWAAYQVWAQGRCISQVETADGTVRKSVFGSLYPLAEWIAENWWLLAQELRPSAVPMRYWTWMNVADQPWLKKHNIRGAGDGMSWPDLTIVVEGSTASVTWFRDSGPRLSPVAFVTQGSAAVPTNDVLEALAGLVQTVLDRLAEKGILKTPLSEEWTSVATSQSDAEEDDFCRTAARLGLDPYATDDFTAEQLMDALELIPVPLRGDFLDSVKVDAISGGAAWLNESLLRAREAASDAPESLSELRAVTRGHIASVAGRGKADPAQPWAVGYALAADVRRWVGLPETGRFDVTPWVGLAEPPDDSHGLQGISVVQDQHCGLVLPRASVPTRDLPPRRLTTATRFGRARALGAALSQPEEKAFLLSPTAAYQQQLARAFAAELLAPATGIRHMLDVLGERTDAAFEAVAGQFEVSPLVIVHQYENQLSSH